MLVLASKCMPLATVPNGLPRSRKPPEEGKGSEMKTGTPQRSVISPTLANIYLHYVFDLWVDVWRTKCAQGDVVVVRYADDIVLGFQHQAEADRFLEKFRGRLGKFGLELHPDKTRRIATAGCINFAPNLYLANHSLMHKEARELEGK